MGRRDRKAMSGVARFLTANLFPSGSPLVRGEDGEPVKKRKVSGRKKYDVSSLAPRYQSIEDVPEHLQKYYAQRHRYFSLYDHGCLLDEEGWYSVTPEKIANQIAERCRCHTILDAFCGVGGNAIAFAKTCHRVIALDNSPIRLSFAQHNATIYDVQDRIEFILCDYLDFARSYIARPQKERNIDVVFLSPPWGGPSYLTDSPLKEEGETEALLQGDYSLGSIYPIPGDKLFHLTRRISHNIAYYLPRNVDLKEVSKLLGPGDAFASNSNLVKTQRDTEEFVEVEEEYMAGKLKALTCYFGGLVTGQEDLF